MRSSLRSMAYAVLLGSALVACSDGSDGGRSGTGDGGRRDGSAVSIPDGATVLSDGAVVLPDGARWTPPMDGSVGGGDGGSTSPPDGSTVLSDGAVVLPDGALWTPPDSGSTGGKDGGSTSPPDGSTVLDDGAVVLPDGGIWTPPDSGSTGDGGTGCGSMEVCGNGIDDNCNGMVDEACPCVPGMTQRCFSGPPSQAGRGVCVLGTMRCEGSGEFGTWGACTGSGSPQPVQCGMMMDFRCDGIIDEGCACALGTTRSCYGGPPGTAGVGACMAGMQSCVMVASGGSEWGPCMGQVTPTPETCDGMDHDCDGTANSGCGCTVGTSRSCYSGPMGTAGVGTCRAGRQTCVASGASADWGACTGEVLPSANQCDGVDRMCTGNASTGCACLSGMTRACYTGPAATRGVGICRDGTQHCVGMGPSVSWETGCPGQTAPAAAEVCGNGLDDNCNGMVDEGCGGTLMCPPNQVVDAGSNINLTVTATGLRPGLTWTITSAPTGGASTAVWNPTPPTATTEGFTPYIVGDYQIQVSGTDASGRAQSCTFTVTARPHGLRVQLTWDGAGDVDLHLHNGTGTPWFNNPDDCFYSNRTPAWGAQLDFDNTSTSGPENTVVNTPALGMNYTIGVHNYAAAAGRRATVQIYCGASLVATYTSRALAGTSSGNCSTNDFWRVARVNFTSPTACTVTAINNYVASSSACTAQ